MSIFAKWHSSSAAVISVESERDISSVIPVFDNSKTHWENKGTVEFGFTPTNIRFTRSLMYIESGQAVERSLSNIQILVH